MTECYRFWDSYFCSLAIYFGKCLPIIRVNLPGDGGYIPPGQVGRTILFIEGYFNNYGTSYR